MTYKLIEITPQIFQINTSKKNHYNLAMLFLRYQEYYESPNPKFFQKPFKILDYLEWYSKKNGNVFSYPSDWSGFNVPGNVIKIILKELLYGTLIDDYNQYDKIMLNFVKNILNEEDESKLFNLEWNFYLIGTSGNIKSNSSLRHEIAHGLYFTNKNYQNEMKKIVSALNPAIVKTFNLWLKNVGYNKSVFVDEIQAYFSTGIPHKVKAMIPLTEGKINNFQKPFRITLKKYFNFKLR